MACNSQSSNSQWRTVGIHPLPLSSYPENKNCVFQRVQQFLEFVLGFLHNIIPLNICELLELIWSGLLLFEILSLPTVTHYVESKNSFCKQTVVRCALTHGALYVSMLRETRSNAVQQVLLLCKHTPNKMTGSSKGSTV